jgi:hypothetical protein
MKIRVLRSVQLTPKLVGYEGDVLELDRSWARRWIARGYVREVEAQAPPLVAGPTPHGAPRDTVQRAGRDFDLEGTQDLEPGEQSLDQAPPAGQSPDLPAPRDVPPTHAPARDRARERKR